MVWIKDREQARSNMLFDSDRGVGNRLYSDNTGYEDNEPTSLTSFNSNGFSLGSSVGSNQNNINFVSWTFREAPEFFDVVSYTGDGTSGRQINHDLGAEPGMVILKKTDSSSDWYVWHR